MNSTNDNADGGAVNHSGGQPPENNPGDQPPDAGWGFAELEGSSSLAALQPDISAIEQTAHFLCDDLVDGECIELRIFGREGSNVGYARSVAEMVGLAAKANTVVSCYAGINSRHGDLYAHAAGEWKTATKTNCGKREHVTRIRFLFLDFDAVKDKEFEKYHATDAEKSAARIATLGILQESELLESAAVWDTGNGVQCVIRVDLPADLSTQGKIECWYKEFQRRFNNPNVKIDSVFNCDRFSKIAGTVHWDRQQDDERPARMSSWIKYENPLTVNNKVRAEVLSMDERATTARAVALVGTTVDINDGLDEWFKEGEIPEKFNELLATDKKVNARWKGDTTGLHDKSGSALDMSLATLLALKGYSGNEIYLILRAFPHGSKNGAAQNPRRHYSRTITEAFESIKRVGLEHFKSFAVLGVEGDKVQIFVHDQQKVYAIDLASLRFIDMVLKCGIEIKHLTGDNKKVSIDGRDLTSLPFSEFQKEIATNARKTDLGVLKKIGTGVWKLKQDMLLVGDEIAVLGRDGTVIPTKLPVIGDYFIRLDPRQHPLPIKRATACLATWDTAASRRSFMCLVGLIGQWRFTKSGAALLLAALLAATFLQALWTWRPLVWLTGQSDAGKSLFLRFLQRVFGPSTILFEGKVSEAGLRQTIQHNSVPVLLDEFEKNPHRERILELLRSSGRGGVVAKGTPGHAAVLFEINHLVWAASVDVGLPREADQNRWQVIEFEKLDKQIGAPDDPGLERLGVDILTSGLKVAPRARDLEHDLKQLQQTGVQSRVRDNLATPAAIAAAILGLTGQQAERLLLGWIKHFGTGPLERDSDHDMLISAILSRNVVVSSPGGSARHMTVAQAVESTCCHDLERFGIRVDDAPNNTVFFVGKVVARDLLKGTMWENVEIHSILARISGARRDRQRVGGMNSRGILVPKQALGM